MCTMYIVLNTIFYACYKIAEEFTTLLDYYYFIILINLFYEHLNFKKIDE